MSPKQKRKAKKDMGKYIPPEQKDILERKPILYHEIKTREHLYEIAHTSKDRAERFRELSNIKGVPNQVAEEIVLNDYFYLPEAPV